MKKKTCNVLLTEDFYDHNGYPYCDEHIYAAQNLICIECGERIDGAVVEFENSRYHTNHFQCYSCKKELNGLPFKKEIVNKETALLIEQRRSQKQDQIEPLNNILNKNINLNDSNAITILLCLDCTKSES